MNCDIRFAFRAIYYLKLFIKPGLFWFWETGPNKNSCPGASEMTWVHSSVDNCFVGVFQKHSTHGIHSMCLLEVDPKEDGVEFSDIVYFSSTLGNFGMIWKFVPNDFLINCTIFYCFFINYLSLAIKHNNFFWYSFFNQS